MDNKIHSIWTFLSDNTICGQPVEKEPRPNSPYEGRDFIIKNISLELDGITCHECKEKKTHAMRT